MYNSFRWVECQFIALAHCPSSQYHLEKALHSLPRSLDETYDRMLMNIDPELADDAKQILTWLCFSSRPVTVEELIEGLMVELQEGNPTLNRERRLQDPNDIIRICPGLISMNTSPQVVPPYVIEDSIDSHEPLEMPMITKIGIAHFSVQEYLESDRIKSRSAAGFALHSRTANTELAKTCLVYLHNVRLTILKEFPLASYAAEHWYHHCQKGDEKSDSLNSMVADFLRYKDGAFQNFIRIYKGDETYRNEDSRKTAKDIPYPLYYASLFGLHQPLKALLETGFMKSEINLPAGSFGNALIAVSLPGHDNVVQLLLDHGAEVNAQVEGRFPNALVAASFQGHDKVVQLLLDHGAKVNAQMEGRFRNALAAASLEGHDKIVQLLLDNGASVNTSGEWNDNALYEALVGGYTKVVQLLLDRVPDISVLLEDGWLLAVASSLGHKEIVELLLNKGVKVNVGTNWTPRALSLASVQGEENVVLRLLDVAAKVNSAISLQASRWGHRNVVRQLLDRDAEPGGDELEAAIDAAIRAALAEDHDGVVKQLLQKRSGAT